MAYNLTLAMQQALNPKDRAIIHTAETIRRMWFLLPAVVANPGTCSSACRERLSTVTTDVRSARWRRWLPAPEAPHPPLP